MRIGYFLYHDISKNDGVTKKVFMQVQQWQRFGHEVKLFVVSEHVPKNYISSEICVPKGGLLKSKFGIYHELNRAVEEFDPDRLYLRYVPFCRNTLVLLRAYKTVIEINSDEIKEQKLVLRKNPNVKNLLSLVANAMTRNFQLQLADGLITVTNELRVRAAKLHHNTIAIPNSADLSIQLQIKKVDVDRRIGFFFIGSPNQSWHGVDLIVGLAERLPEYDFHIVGSEGESTTNLFYYGYRTEYDDILAKCDISIGSLALFRENMLEACPLKVREYLARGFPVIIGYEDTAFLKELPNFILKIDLSKGISQKSIQEIKSFAKKMKNYIVRRDEIESIDSTVVESQRLKFMTQL
ncbi:glycosyltransferase family protein [Spirochaeta lutea]|uniref:Glycosyltransferase subfamily 4-like N-terminal domain-containing protein n=1 Tax=Spirochaeta lutea TaxID=1480694 RepID=A0A098QXB2_9SPIO|nr:hypothetical protein [Spirochaeta lutea]KGE71132.1 hypothetical protein DC28_12850 [Spirochaeta lutea]